MYYYLFKKLKSLFFPKEEKEEILPIVIPNFIVITPEIRRRPNITTRQRFILELNESDLESSSDDGDSNLGGLRTTNIELEKGFENNDSVSDLKKKDLDTDYKTLFRYRFQKWI